MKTTMRLAIIFGLAMLLTVPAVAGTLRAGAARVDITPPENSALPMGGYGARKSGFEGIHDRLYARAIVVDDGARQAAIVTADISGMSHKFWEETSRRMAAETGIPHENILLAATHTHGGPSLVATQGDMDAKVVNYATEYAGKLLRVLKEAKAALQPARVGFGEGRANISINRRALMPEGDYWLGDNPAGASDKTVAVTKFESPSGRPIALLINYAVHGTVMGSTNMQITGDLPGATSRFVESQFDGRVVALWSSGAAGDQKPNRKGAFADADALGRILGQEAIRVAAGMRLAGSAEVRAAQKTVTCPGKKNPPGPQRRKDNKYEFLDADPVEIRLSLLMIGQTAIAGVSGEVLTLIGQRLKKESPFPNTMMLTHCNGSSGYIPDDAAYEQVTYEIVSSHLKRGCAENAIVNGFLELMNQVRPKRP